jgi:hypothetical protein
MEKKELLIGFFIGIIAAIIGTFLFLIAFTEFNSISDLQIVRQQGILGKVITIGAILNLVVFFILLKKKKDFMARGIVLSMIVLTVFTLFL